MQPANQPTLADGYTCTTDDLLDVLLGVAANRGTIEAVCADLVGTPDAEMIRGYFKDQLRVDDLPELAKSVIDTPESLGIMSLWSDT